MSLLEIGVKDGASLRTWKSYFRRGRIFGIDIDPASRRSEESRISVEVGSQDDLPFLRACFGRNPTFDIIIDDGSHINEMIIDSFQYLFNERLATGGLYVIEDLRCSYEKLQTEQHVLEVWPGMKYNARNKSFDNDRDLMNKFFLKQIDQLDHRSGNIRLVHFWSMICIIEKA